MAVLMVYTRVSRRLSAYAWLLDGLDTVNVDSIRLRLDIATMAASCIRSPDAIQRLADIDTIDRLPGFYRMAFKSSVDASLEMCNCE